MKCPTCNSSSVATLVVGEKTHGYCPLHDRWFPDLEGGWSPWDADWNKHVKKETETVKQRRERMGGGSQLY